MDAIESREEGRGPCAAFRRETSRGGKKLGELKSGLQKYIRRGGLAEALWCAGELHSFRDAPEEDGRKRIATNFRHRLMVIALEDVGDIGLWARLDALLGALADARAVHEWVWLLASAPKARVCSHARAVAALRGAGDPEGLALALRLYPTIAASLTAHLADLRSSFRREADWRGALVQALRARSPDACLWAWAIQSQGLPRSVGGKRKPVWQIFAALREGASPAVCQVLPIAERWFKELQNTQEAFLCWMLPLLAHVRDFPFDPAGLVKAYVPPLESQDLFSLPGGGPLELAAFVYDIHTNAGPRRGEGGLVRFALEGCLVEGESPIVDAVWKAFYEDRKRAADGADAAGPPRPAREEVPEDRERVADPPDPALDDYIEDLLDGMPVPGEVPAALPGRETDYEFVVRAQITTSRGKTDVYFARAPGSRRLVVLKGPFATARGPENAAAMSGWKAKCGLPAVAMTPVRLLPDRWPDGVPLGLRNQLPRDEPAWFLEAASLIPEPLPMRLHEPTKAWPATQVVDWEGLGAHVWAPAKKWEGEYGHGLRRDYVLALLARCVAGVSDLADRNFVLAGGRLYSVDEDARVPAVRFYVELRKNKAALVRNWLESNWAEVEAAVRAWVDVPSLERWALVRNKKTALALFEE